ncbi:glycosyltransferase family 4 protein [Compostibacter hankyongensis]
MKKYSGGELVMERLILNLDSKSYQSIIALPEGEFSARCIVNNIPVLINNNIPRLNRGEGKINYLVYLLKLFKGILEISGYVKRNGFDIIIANSFGVSLHAGLIGLLTGRKVLWIHHHPVFQKEGINASIARFASRLSHSVVCVSNALKRSLIDIRIPEQKIRVIYNGLDLDSFRPLKNDVVNEKITISIVGIISKWKGHQYLFNAVHLMSRDIKNRILIDVVGGFIHNSPNDLKYKHELDDFLARYNLQKIVRFVGYKHDMKPYYGTKVDVLVNCSQEPEPLGTTIYEAMSFEKIVIVTDLGGNVEIVSHLIDGFIVDHRSPLSLAQCLTHVVNNYRTAEIEGIRKNARKKVTTLFDIKTSVKSYMKVFDEIVS